MNWDTLSAQLIAHEGLRLRAYRDHLGYWTIGVGHLIDPLKGGDTRYRLSPETKIDKGEALGLLHDDVLKVVKQLDNQLPWWSKLDDVRQNVLVEMGFQLGISGLLNFKNTLRSIKDGRWDDASTGMLNSKWASQTPNRAKTLARQMRTGVA